MHREERSLLKGHWLKICAHLNRVHSRLGLAEAEDGADLAHAGADEANSFCVSLLLDALKCLPCCLQEALTVMKSPFRNMRGLTAQAPQRLDQ